jgi:transposase-like protein
MNLVALVREHLGHAHPDVTCSLRATFVEALMGAEVDALYGAGYRVPRPERTNRRKRLSPASLATRGLAPPARAIPSCAEGSSSPDCMLERRRRLEVAPTSMMATCGVLGVPTGRLETLAVRTWDHHALQVPALRERWSTAWMPRSRRSYTSPGYRPLADHLARCARRQRQL